jgi:SAM-dependent methyltransferase
VPDDTATAAREAAAHLEGHRWVARAHADGDRVRLVPHTHLLASVPRPGELVAEHLEQWGEVYELTYGDGTGGDFDLRGWRASDTGEPLPAGHMAEWVTRTVDLVAGLRPRHVVELGCGTGMLLRRLAAGVEGYVGTDVAEHAVRAVSAAAPPHARVVRAAAHELTGPAVTAAVTELGFPAGRPDLVLLNSVTQCFPDTGYLAAVVAAAVSAVAPGGHVVVGDNRHSGLLTEFSAWVERSRSPGADDAELARRAAARAERDEELLFDPPALARAAASTGRDVRMVALPKALTGDSELTRYRFDAVLRVDGPAPAPEPPVRRWPDLAGRDVAAVVRGGPVRLVDVPNGALVPGAPTAARLREELAGLDAAVVLAADDPHRLEVVSPASAAWRPLAEIAAATGAGAHEPLRRFARQRLTAAARGHLRRPGLAGVPVEIDLDGAR